MPKIILIHGPMAAGKSTITAKLLDKLPIYAYIDRPMIKRGLKPLGKDEAKRLSKKACYGLIREIMKMGKNMVAQEISPVSLHKKLGKYLKEYKYSVHSFYLQCSIDVAKQRDKERAKKTRPVLLKKIHDTYPGPSKYDMIIDTEKLSVKQSVSRILRVIK